MSIDFELATTKDLKKLSPAQVQDFNNLGYISPLEGLLEEETRLSRTYFDSLMRTMKGFGDNRNSYAIMGYHNRCRGIYDLALTPRFLDYVEDLLGPDFVMWSSHYFCKEAYDKKRVPWHQDATYWPIRPTRTVTIWLAIDDVTPFNSAMRFLPRSHNYGRIEWEKASGEVVLQQEITDLSTYDAPFENILKAGEISIHTSTLIHGSEPNISNTRRCGLALRYVPSTCGVKPGSESVLSNAIVCRGNPGAWKNNMRPKADNLERIHNAYIEKETVE